MQRTNNSSGTVQVFQVLENSVHATDNLDLLLHKMLDRLLKNVSISANTGNIGIATTVPNARLSIQANSSNEGMELQTPVSGSFQIGVHNVFRY